MATAQVESVTITNADKVWWPDEGVTKGDVARHYARVATRLLPFTIDRPLTVERCPDGFRGRCFYQKNFAMAEKLGVATAAIRAASVNRTVNYPLGNDLRTLLALVNLGGLSLHLAGSRASSLPLADWLAFDLDPPARFADAVQAALVLRELLDEVGLRGYPKTTGARGCTCWFRCARGGAMLRSSTTRRRWPSASCRRRHAWPRSASRSARGAAACTSTSGATSSAPRSSRRTRSATARTRRCRRHCGGTTCAPISTRRT